MKTLNLRVATLNIGGGEKTFEESNHDTQQSRLKALEMLIKRLDADVLCLQEVSQYIDADGANHSLMDKISDVGKYQHAFYGKTVSMETHMQVKKDVMVRGIFNDWWNWSKGNAIHARVPFARLGDPNRSGLPRNIPIFRPLAYEGNRDTDPRAALLTRLKEAPFPFVSTLHLTTLVGERLPDATPLIKEKAHLMRFQQVSRLLDLVRANILEKNEPLIVAGDFNAMADEHCINHLLASVPEFVRLVPDNDGPTHPDVERAVDHIFFYPRQRLVSYTCHIETCDLSRRASDHLPVVADLEIK
ncbi:MAG: endonuclease/exonuclease/phosphatase family protein [Brevefilum sp.]|nr:endonuclease/exonuclease/phosphatase family protein [Brevefilum sp.]